MWKNWLARYLWWKETTEESLPLEEENTNEAERKEPE